MKYEVLDAASGSVCCAVMAVTCLVFMISVGVIVFRGVTNESDITTRRCVQVITACLVILGFFVVTVLAVSAVLWAVRAVELSSPN